MGGSQLGRETSARGTGRGVLRAAALLLPLLSAACSATSDPEPATDEGGDGKGSALSVDTVYTVDGWMSLEDEYIPRVCTQENGAADFEALKVQAVSARTYLLRSMRDDPQLGTQGKPVINGQSFQAYAPSASEACRAATEATRGVVGRYAGELIIANYVAGALVNADGSKGNDPTKTEKWITYNEGKTGADVQPTALSYKARTDNRGCMGQNRSDWLSENGYDYAKILRYFFGADLELNDPAVTPAEPGGGACGAVTYQGECQGDTVVWCEGGEVKSVDCAGRGKVCAFESDAVGYNCVEAPTSGCGAVTYAGECDGAVLTWCNDKGELETYDCSSTGQVCGWQNGDVGNNCL
jgi:hypothetical protein